MVEILMRSELSWRICGRICSLVASRVELVVA